MKTKKTRSTITLLLAISLIFASTLGVQMQSVYATGLDDSYNPSINAYICYYNGNSIYAYANSNFTLDSTYPRMVTNSTELRLCFNGYDSTGISNVNIKLIKAPESNQLYSWRQPGFPGLVWEKDFNDIITGMTYNYDFDEITEPGTYVVLTTITAGNGRTSEDIQYLLWGPGRYVPGDFNNRICRPEGQALFCTVYDLGEGTPESASTLSNNFMFVHKPESAFWYSGALTITQDPTFERRYKLSGYGIRPAELEAINAPYEARFWLNFEIMNFPFYY